mgnify:CR=1 FL=1
MKTSEYVPHPYQERVIDRGVRDARLGKLLDPGLGKTSITLEVFRRLRAQFEVSRLLVVAPLRVAYSVWPHEAQKWAQFRELRVHVLHGDGLHPHWLEQDAADVLVINPEGLEWLAHQRRARLPEMIAVDESTKFKRTSAKRSRILKHLLKRIPHRRYILTGTPAPNGLGDLHGQVRILDDGAALGDTLKEFRERFCSYVPNGTPYGGVWEVRTSARAEILRLVEPLVIRLDARDYLDLPELVRVDVPVRLPPAAAELYARLRHDLVVQFEAGAVVATNAGALSGKLRQVASGSVYLTPDGAVSEAPTRRWEVIHDEKARALVDLFEELGGKPLLIAFEFEHEREVIRRALKPIAGEVPVIAGGVSAKRGAELERLWNAGRLPVLLVHPAAAAHGLNLQAGGHHIAFYTSPWDLELYDQLIGRLYRQGQQEDRVFVHHLVAQGTIDERVSAVLRRKGRDQGDLLEALRLAALAT